MLSILSTIFHDSLKLTEDEIKKHGILICAGDQLSLSLLDKVPFYPDHESLTKLKFLRYLAFIAMTPTSWIM